MKIIEPNLSISFLTRQPIMRKQRINGEEHLFVEWGARRTIGQMFFQPYESIEEFFCSMNHTFIPMQLVLFSIASPLCLIAMPIILGGIAAGCAAIGGINKLRGDDSNASFFLDMAVHVIKGLAQSLIDLVVLPLSALIMLTRGVSTGLHAAGIIGGADEVPPPAPSI